MVSSTGCCRIYSGNDNFAGLAAVTMDVAAQLEATWAQVRVEQQIQQEPICGSQLMTEQERNAQGEKMR